MALEGLHHITAITGDAPRNVDFYARLLGLRLVKKTVNFDAPDVYHLYYGDEAGTPGSILTFFEFPGAQPGRAGDGDGPHDPVARRARRTRSTSGPRGWATPASRPSATARRCASPTSRACATSCSPSTVADAPLAAAVARHPARARAARASTACARTRAVPERSAGLLGALGFERGGDTDAHWRVAGDERHAVLAYEPPPPERGRTSAGTIHHIAWSAPTTTSCATTAPARSAAGAHADRHHRPPVLPLGLLPRAQRRPLRARLAATSASRTTSRSSRSARR